MAVRTTAGWYIWTHQLVEVTGQDAAKLLDYIYTNPIGNLKIGSERYTTALNRKGEIIDDVVVFRMGEEKFWISTLFASKCMNWLEENRNDFQVQFEDITSQYHMIAVQGPKSLDIINTLTETPVDEQKFFTFRKNKIDNISVMINRAGFTGEKKGYEIYFAAEELPGMIDKLNQTAPEFDALQVSEFQIMAWTLPTEAGFYYMRDLLYTNPLEVGLDRGISWDKEFIGKKALEKIKKKGAKRTMVGFTMEDADVRINGKDLGGPGTLVSINDEEIGHVSKFNYSYVLEKPIGYLLVKSGTVQVGDHVTIGNKYDAVITEKSFLHGNGGKS